MSSSYSAWRPSASTRLLCADERLSLDGFVAGPGHAMDWMTGFSHRSGPIDEYAETTGAVLGGRDGWNSHPAPA
ncbi:hypothetical protein [Streptomyces sp. NPDC058632]|uniref:hypothetical protein n=1 Tax=Streptomyces sp. NPDC058632 TaxID=3346567 RepID=UPI0036677BA8